MPSAFRFPGRRARGEKVSKRKTNDEQFDEPEVLSQDPEPVEAPVAPQEAVTLPDLTEVTPTADHEAVARSLAPDSVRAAVRFLENARGRHRNYKNLELDARALVAHILALSDVVKRATSSS